MNGFLTIAEQGVHARQFAAKNGKKRKIDT
jgi:hypothetical protein